MPTLCRTAQSTPAESPRYETTFAVLKYAEKQHARVALQATDERAFNWLPERLAELTPEEAQISRLMACGATDPGIATRLDFSVSTVDYPRHTRTHRAARPGRPRRSRRRLLGTIADFGDQESIVPPRPSAANTRPRRPEDLLSLAGRIAGQLGLCQSSSLGLCRMCGA